jgi:hypothetical protein
MVRVVSAASLAAALFCAAPAHAATFTIEYDASILNVVQLGKMSLSGKIAAPAYDAKASVQTAGLAALFDDTKISVSSSGAVEAQGLSWRRYDLSHAYAKKFRKIGMERTPAGVSTTITPKYNDMGTPPASDAQKKAARDPLSSLVEMGRAVGASKKCEGTYATFDGRGYYLLVLSPKGQGTYKGGGYDGAALICTLKYAPTAGFKPMSAAERAKIPQAEIWFADPVGGFAAPLRLEVPTPVGAGRLDIKQISVK